MSIKIAPSILAADFGAFAAAAKSLTDAGADYIHFDIMDGHFVPNISFGPNVIRTLRSVTDTPFDTHLMIERPEQFVAEFAQAGSQIVTIHPETTYHLNRLVHEIKDSGAQAGVALNPATSVSMIEWVLADLDHILVMTVNPGFGGQAFLPGMLPKIRALAERRAAQGLHFQIAVDGGVNAETAPLCVQAGADMLIAGSAVFHHPGGVQGGLDAIRRAVGGD